MTKSRMSLGRAKTNPKAVQSVSEAFTAAEQAVGAGETRRIQIDTISVDPDQIRQELLVSHQDMALGEVCESIEEFSDRRKQFDEIVQLAQTIAQHGVLQALIVYMLPGGLFRLIAGERRYLAVIYAVNHLDFDGYVDTRIFPKKPDQALLDDIQFIENHHRKELTLFEVTSWVLRRFRQFEEDHNREIAVEDIQRIMGVKKSNAYLYKAFHNAEADWAAELLELVKTQKITGIKQLADYAKNRNKANEELTPNSKPSAEPRNAKKISLGSTANHHAIKSLVMENITKEDREKFKDVNWDNPKQVSKAFKEFIALWERRHV